MNSQREQIRVTRLSFKKYLKLNLTVLRMIRLLPLPEDATMFDKIFDFLTVLPFLSMLNIIVVPNFLTFYRGESSIDVVMECVCNSIQALASQVKYAILLLRRNKIKEVIESCQDLWETYHPRSYEILLQHIKKAYLITRLFFAAFMLTAVCFTIVPYFLKSSESPEGLPVAPGFVIKNEVINDVIGYTQCFIVCLGGFVVAAIDSLLPVLLLISCGQFELIRIMLGDIEEKHELLSKNVNGVDSFERSFKADLNDCINRHQRLLAHYAKIEDTFNIYCLIQILMGLYTIAFGLFNLSRGAADSLKFGTILVLGVFQVYVCNWSPEKVLKENQKTYQAVYEIPWHKGNHSSRRTTCLFLMNMQRSVPLTAGKFIVLSTETFSSVITNAMSLLTVLKTVT